MPVGSGRRLALLALALALAVAIVLLTQLATGRPAARAGSPGEVLIRVNQLGYGPGDRKLAYVMSTRATGELALTLTRAGDRERVAVGVAQRRCPAWSMRYRGCRTADFTGLRRPGRYVLRIGAASSPSFWVSTGAKLYGGLVANAAAFLTAQRDGTEIVPGALGRRPAHRNDARARVYATPGYRNGALASSVLVPTRVTADVGGGWFDAGDYLKFTATASFTDTVLLFSLREYAAAGLPATSQLLGEARVGTDWLLKMWNPRTKVLLEQVGIGDGRGDAVLGDHDLWRLPQADDRLRGGPSRYLAHRPVFAVNAPGKPVSPNLGGRTAAAFALCAQVFAATDPGYAHRCLLAGQTLYDAAAKSWRGRLRDSVPSEYYPEREWRDDMELAATELYLATRATPAADLPHRSAGDYLTPAGTWADQYMSEKSAGQDALNFYDVAGIAHYDLVRVLRSTGPLRRVPTDTGALLADLRDQLALASRLSRSGPFGLADPATPEDTVSHAFGYAIEARLYDALIGRPAYEALAEQQIGWVLGANPWGSSFVIGAGSLFPRCPAHEVANLAGSLSGRGALLLGGVVAGPSARVVAASLGAPDGYRPCSADSAGLRLLDGRGFGYLDDVRSSTTSEPSNDLASLSLLAFAQAAMRR